MIKQNNQNKKDRNKNYSLCYKVEIIINYSSKNYSVNLGINKRSQLYYTSLNFYEYLLICITLFAIYYFNFLSLFLHYTIILSLLRGVDQINNISTKQSVNLINFFLI